MVIMSRVIEEVSRLVEKRWFIHAVGRRNVELIKKLIDLAKMGVEVDGEGDLQLDMDKILKVGNYIYTHYVVEGRCILCNEELRNVVESYNHYRKKHFKILTKILKKIQL